MPDANPAGPRHSPAKIFWLTLAAPGLGHLAGGNRGRARWAAAGTLALLALAVIAATLPPVNLPVLVLMAVPLVALPVFVLAAGFDAAREAARNEGAGPPMALATPPLAVLGIVAWVVEIAACVGLALWLSNTGVYTVADDHMAPTLLGGDRVVVWRDYYRDHLPERGDVAVVMTPESHEPRIMRIIGLPGDSLLSVLGTLTVNGKAIEQTRIGDFGWRDSASMHRSAPRYEETLPGGRTYEVLQSAEGLFRGTLLGASLRIPDGDYFVIGDNRDETKSSWDFGFLPGLVLSDRPTVIIGSGDRSRIGRTIQP